MFYSTANETDSHWPVRLPPLRRLRYLRAQALFRMRNKASICSLTINSLLRCWLNC